MNIDWEAIKTLGTATGVTGVIAGIAFYVVREVLRIGDKHLTKQVENHMKILESHEKERSSWMVSLMKFNETIDRASAYQREEHSKMIQILERIDRAVSK